MQETFKFGGEKTKLDLVWLLWGMVRVVSEFEYSYFVKGQPIGLNYDFLELRLSSLNLNMNQKTIHSHRN